MTQRLKDVPGGLPALGVTGFIQPADIDFSATNNAKGLITAGNISQIMANGAIAAATIANNTITSNQIAVDVIQHTTGNLTANQIIAMGPTPVTLLPAVAGKSYKVIGFALGLNLQANNVAFTGGAAVVVQCNGVNTTVANIAASVITGNAATPGFYVDGANTQTLAQNQALSITTANSAAFAAGSNATAQYDLWTMLS